MSLIFKQALDRMRAGAYDVYGLSNLDEWIIKNTRINQKPFSFKDREFQIPILQDPARNSYIVKCAQVGLSELAYRWAIAACCVMKNFTVIYTFPTSSDAEKNNRMRIDPMIEGSPEVKRLVNPEMNNSQMKQFGENSFLVFAGTFSKNTGLSTPADALIHDEYDKSDLTQTSVYVSRLQDRTTKIKKVFSTPTLANYGIDKEVQSSRRYRHLAKCNCCNHVFLPDYFSHVVIPGWDKPMEEITKQNIHMVNWEEAQLICPKCGRDPDLHYTRMEYVCENPSEHHNANGWFVSPFSAHKRISVPYLVETSTKFKRYSEFKNQTLGLTAEESAESITQNDIDTMQSYPNLDDSGAIHQAGIDLGIMCNVSIGRESYDGDMLVVHRERIHYTKLEARMVELRIKYRLSIEVYDVYPYSDVVTRICAQYPNSWGAYFVNTKSPQTFTLQEYEEDEETASLALRLVKINRTAAFDDLLVKIKSRRVKIAASEENDIFSKQMQSLKRKQEYMSDGDFKYVWVKTGDEDDHYHFSLMYLSVAIDMRKVAGLPGLLSTEMDPIMVMRKPKSRRTPSGIYF